MIYRNSSKLWEANISVPIEMHEQITCFFRATIIKPGYVYGQRQNTEESKPYTIISRESVQRVHSVWKHSDSDFSEHLKDILVGSNRSNLKDKVMQVESLCHSHPYRSKVDINATLSSLFMSPCLFTPEQRLLIIVILGNLCFEDVRNIHKVRNDILTNERRKTLLSSLKIFSSSEMTESCKKFMLDLSIELFKTRIYGEYNFLNFVCETYPFFEETQILGKLTEIQNSGYSQRFMVVDQQNEHTVLDFLKRANHDGEFFMRLLLEIPAETALHVYMYITKHASIRLDRANDIRDCIVLKIKQALNSLQMTLEKIFNTWITIKWCAEIALLCKKEFEKVILQRLIKGDTTGIDILKQCIQGEGLFEAPTTQTEFIQTLKDIRNISFQLKMIEVIFSDKFMTTCKTTDPKLFKDCFVTAFKAYKLERKSSYEPILKKVYANYMSTVLKTPFMKEAEDLKRHLSLTAVDFLKSFEINNLMKTIMGAKSVFAENPGLVDLFCEDMRLLLQSKTNHNYHELLFNLCDAKGNLQIGSK